MSEWMKEGIWNNSFLSQGANDYSLPWSFLVRTVHCPPGSLGFLGNSWVQEHFFPRCRLPGSFDFPLWSNEEQSRCDTEQISNTSLIPTWEAVVLPFNYNSAFSMAKKNRDTILTKAKTICLQLIPINTFQVTRLAVKWWFLYSREPSCEGFIFYLWKRESN